MKNKILKLFLVLSCIFFPLRIFAWGTTGHRIVADIAQADISPKTKTAIGRLLKNYPMAYWANWADNLRSDTSGKWNNTFEWHYMDMEGGLSEEEFMHKMKSSDKGNVYNALRHLISDMKEKNLSDSEKRVDLYFIIHFVGDMHQPFHIGHPEDLGGNKIKVFWFGRSTNIHAVWDSELIDFQKYSYTEYASILNTLSPSEKKDLQRGTLEDWLYETYEITGKLYENVKEGDSLSYEYVYQYTPVVESQLRKAGLRLALILNEIFDK